MEISEKLNIPEGFQGLSLVKKAVKELKFQIWIRDLVSPPKKPVSRKYHECIRDLLKFTDDVLEIIDREIAKEDDNAGL